MGLLAVGRPLNWEQTQKYKHAVHENGVQQFLSIYHKMKKERHNRFLFGDEVEYMIIDYDDEKKNAKLSLRAAEVLRQLQKEEEEALKNPDSGVVLKALWRPEYGRYMIEGTPGTPYGGSLKELLKVESNMKLRRETAEKCLKPNEAIITLTSYPRLGVKGQFLEPHYEPRGPVSKSLFVPDEIINAHIRFPTLTANIRKRRGSKVAINVPIFHDEKTPKPFIDPTVPHDRNLNEESGEDATLPEHIHMDAMVFGMGCGCLQLTFQACNIDEARRLYDQLAIMGPIM
ncbi:15965_t:CDS:2, partial [Acaulospora morrowiae]